MVHWSHLNAVMPPPGSAPSVRTWTAVLLLLALFLAGCDGMSSEEPDAHAGPDNSFSYRTTHDVTLTVAVRAPNQAPLPNVPLTVYNGPPSDEGAVVWRGASDERGRAETIVRVPRAAKQLVVQTTYPSLPSEVAVPLDGQQAYLTLGGRTDRSSSDRSSSAASFGRGKAAKAGTYDAMGPVGANGVPGYLAAEPDFISPDLLQTIDASLPENDPVPSAHPEYLASGNETNLVMQDSVAVWVTFVHEGAGYRNALGFYTYEAGNPPQTVDEIDSHRVIFPNTSFANSGGGLQPGDRVFLGRFSPGTAFGWFLIADGWRNGSLTDGNHVIYSEPALNPEDDPALRQHSVLLADAANELVLLGFEDMLRDRGSDNDFNDAIFYVTANPFTAVETAALPDAQPGDGDSAPSQFVSFMPGEDAYATLAFEDLWPGTGDYDFNDLVVDYNFAVTETPRGDVTALRGTFVTRAIGGALHNGLAVELPVGTNVVQSVTGQDLRTGLVTTRGNGTEAGTGKRAIIPIYDDAYNRLPNTGSSFRNTDPSAPSVLPDTMTVTITFKRPIDADVLGTPPYNPFIFVGGERGREVHLPDMPPTSKADPSLFGQSGDASDPETGRYYKTDDNLPWALHMPRSFAYPVEKTDIRAAYNGFAPWARSNGTRFRSWYQPLHRVESLTY